MKKIVFRADAHPKIGTGDLVSLIHLSKYFEKNNWETHFIIRNHNTAITLAQTFGIDNRFLIDSNISVGQEVEEINRYIDSNNIDAIVLEITERKLTEYKNLSDRVFKASICFSDEIPENFDLVISWDTDIQKRINISNYPKTKFLLGTEYVILPIDFDFQLIKNRIFKENPQNLLIAMGGADEFNLTKNIVEILIDCKTDLKLIVIIGAGYRYLDELRSILSVSSIKYEIKKNITNVFSEYMNCDLAIGTGGLTAYELIATRTPTILIATYEHQISRCKFFNKKGWVKYLGYKDFGKSLLMKYVKEPLIIKEECNFQPDKIRELIDELHKRRNS